MSGIQPFSSTPAQAVFSVNEAAKRQMERTTRGQGFYGRGFPIALYIIGAVLLTSGLAGAVLLAASMTGHDARLVPLDGEELQAIAWVLAPSALICGGTLVLAGRIRQKHKTMMRTDESLWLAGGCLWYAWHRPLDGEAVAGPQDGTRVGRPASVNVVAIELAKTSVFLDEDGFFVFRGGIRGAYFEDGVSAPVGFADLGQDDALREVQIGNYFDVDLRRLSASPARNRA